MASLSFDRPSNRITLRAASGNEMAAWEARNNVDSHFSHWPPGTYAFSHFKTHADDAPDSAYGSIGIFVFTVPGHVGLGVHSGRQDVPDGLQRSGPAHATNGCIRTTDKAMTAIKAAHDTDPLTQISVN
jgi:hypothetical protein